MLSFNIEPKVPKEKAKPVKKGTLYIWAIQARNGIQNSLLYPCRVVIYLCGNGFKCESTVPLHSQSRVQSPREGTQTSKQN